MSFGEVHLDFQIENSHVLEMSPGKLGGWEKEGKTTLCSPWSFPVKVNVFKNWVGPLSPNLIQKF